MKNVKQPLAKRVAQTILFFLFLVLFHACKNKTDVAGPANQAIFTTTSISEQMGLVFYEHISQHALEDPLKGLSESYRQLLSAQFDNLKASGNISAKAVLDQALARGQVSQAMYTIWLKYDQDLVIYAQQNPEVELCLKWCLAQEEAVKARQDLDDLEKEQLLTHQAILRYYVKYTLETLPSEALPYTRTDKNARTEGAQTILCYLGCAVSNIGGFSGVGALADGQNTHVGQYTGAGVGLIFTIINSEACGCGSNSTCRAATSISTPDVCYSAPVGSTTQGKSFTAWGYGVIPGNGFVWEFYTDDLGTFLKRDQTFTDQYTLTDAIWRSTASNNGLQGRDRYAILLNSKCTGMADQNSQYLFFSKQDAGKPRPTITVTTISQQPTLQVRYVVGGTNVQTVQFAYIPPYRGTIISQTSNSAIVQWVSSSMRIGVYVTATSSCGTAYASAY